MTTLHDLIAQAMQKKEEEKRIAEEQAAKERYWKIPICDDDDDNDYTIAITPVLSTEEPVNSLIMENEHLDTISATESDEFIKSSVEILVPIPSESKGVPKVFLSNNDHEEDILLIKDDTLHEKLLNVNRLVAKIKALKDNPVPSSVVVTKSTSTFPNLFLEGQTHFDISMPEIENFLAFNYEEPITSSGSTTTYSDSSFSKYDSFIFDLSINSYHPSNRSDFHEEFADELAQIISQPEYDCFFKDEPELGNFTMDVVGNIFQKREPRVHVLNVLPILEQDFIPTSEFFAYVVWIFLPFLFIPVIPPKHLSPLWIARNVNILNPSDGEESAVKPEPELKNTIGCNLNPSDGPGKPNSISMKTVKTKWALNQLQQPICMHLTKTVKTLKAQS
ncbi:hypothetical protein Tco_0967323 [Tanacetum coccineum]